MRDCWAITGAAGFIGRELIERLHRENVRVRALQRGDGAIPYGEVVRGDVRDAEVLRRLVEGCDVVVHLAGFVHRPTRTDRERAECWSINEGGTRAVVEAIAEWAPSAFLIYVSTANVYPVADVLLDEGATVRPKTIYGASKLAAEAIVLEAIAEGRIRGAILRPSMVFGPAAPGNLARLVGMLRRGVALRFDGGRNRKSIAPVQLVVDAIMAVARDAARSSGEIYNVAGATFTMAELQEQIARALEVRIRRISLPVAPFALAARLVDLLLRPTALPSIAQLVETFGATAAIADEKLRALPSFVSDVDVEEALRTTVRAPLPKRRRLQTSSRAD